MAGVHSRTQSLRLSGPHKGGQRGTNQLTVTAWCECGKNRHLEEDLASCFCSDFSDEFFSVASDFTAIQHMHGAELLNLFITK